MLLRHSSDGKNSVSTPRAICSDPSTYNLTKKRRVLVTPMLKYETPYWLQDSHSVLIVGVGAINIPVYKTLTFISRIGLPRCLASKP